MDMIVRLKGFITARQRNGAISTSIILLLILTSFNVLSAPSCEKNPKFCDPPPPDEGDTWMFHAVSHSPLEGIYTSKEYQITGDTKNLVFNKTGGNNYWLSKYFVDRNYNGRSGGNCFGPASKNRAGTMQLADDLGKNSDLVAVFWFRASNDPVDPADEINDLKYVLELYNDSEGWFGIFPPDQTGSSRTATHWKMRTERKGSLNNEPCVTNGLESFNSGEGVDFDVRRVP